MKTKVVKPRTEENLHLAALEVETFCKKHDFVLVKLANWTFRVSSLYRTVDVYLTTKSFYCSTYNKKGTYQHLSRFLHSEFKIR